MNKNQKKMNNQLQQLTELHQKVKRYATKFFGGGDGSNYIRSFILHEDHIEVFDEANWRYSDSLDNDSYIITPEDLELSDEGGHTLMYCEQAAFACAEITKQTIIDFSTWLWRNVDEKTITSKSWDTLYEEYIKHKNQTQ